MEEKRFHEQKRLPYQIQGALEEDKRNAGEEKKQIIFFSRRPRGKKRENLNCGKV